MDLISLQTLLKRVNKVFKLKPARNLLVLISVAACSLLQINPAQAARYALLIGNDSYQEVPALRNARADAEAMAQALQKAGYVTTVVKDRNLKQMKDDVRSFKANVHGGDEVVLFYSGHGVQIEAMNYLLPVDVRADSEDQVRDDGLALSRVLDDLRQQKPAFTLAVIDACRDNPFKGTGRAIGGRGLTGVGGANGQMVIYSAGEGQQALDSLSENDPVKNGLFTRVFIKEMERPGVPVDQVARRVRAEVNRMALTVKHEQVPAIYDQVIGQFYFYAKNDAGSNKRSLPSDSQVELMFWDSVKNSRDSNEIKAYLDKYPNGQFTGLAQARLKNIEAKNHSSSAATTVPVTAPVTENKSVTIPDKEPITETAKPIAEPAKISSSEKESKAVSEQATAPVPVSPEPVKVETVNPIAEKPSNDSTVTAKEESKASALPMAESIPALKTDAPTPVTADPAPVSSAAPNSDSATAAPIAPQ